MMAQDMRLKASNVTRTNLATGPVLESKSRVSPPKKKAEYMKNCIDAIIDDSRAVFWRDVSQT
jgi:hypothetical protein